jgi:hypothetical protein
MHHEPSAICHINGIRLQAGFVDVGRTEFGVIEAFGVRQAPGCIYLFLVYIQAGGTRALRGRPAGDVAQAASELDKPASALETTAKQ